MIHWPFEGFGFLEMPESAEAEAAINRPYAALVNDIEVPLHSELDATRLAEFRDKRVEVAPGRRGQEPLT